MPKEIKYGYVYGPACEVPDWPIAASVTFSNRGGKFVIVDANNRIDRAGAAIEAVELSRKPSDDNGPQS